MAVQAVCPVCGATLAAGPCDSCAGSLNTPNTSRARYAGFWQRLVIACLPATVLALFVQSTLYGYVLYLGVYLTYLAWAEATTSPPPAPNT